MASKRKTKVVQKFEVSQINLRKKTRTPSKTEADWSKCVSLSKRLVKTCVMTRKAMIADEKEEVQTMKIRICGKNMRIWNIIFSGPKDTPYALGRFMLQVWFPLDYPFKAPKIFFKTKIFHCNVDYRGNICLNVLKDQYSAAMSLFDIVITIQELLSNPNADDPLNDQAATLFTSNRTNHDTVAKAFTNKYAVCDEKIANESIAKLVAMANVSVGSQPNLKLELIAQAIERNFVLWHQNDPKSFTDELENGQVDKGVLNSSKKENAQAKGTIMKDLENALDFSEKEHTKIMKQINKDLKEAEDKEAEADKEAPESQNAMEIEEMVEGVDAGACLALVKEAIEEIDGEAGATKNSIFKWFSTNHPDFERDLVCKAISLGKELKELVKGSTKARLKLALKVGGKRNASNMEKNDESQPPKKKSTTKEKTASPKGKKSKAKKSPKGKKKTSNKKGKKKAKTKKKTVSK